MTKKILIAFAIILTTITGLSAQVKTEPLFPLPEVPAELTSLQDRTDYVITHFWDRCNFKNAMSSKDKFADSFDTYVGLMPHGSRRAVMRSIYTLLAQLEKQPKELMFIAEQAEALMYSDTAKMLSDEAYLPFARAIADNKKIDRASKARYGEQARILMQSGVGMIAPEMEYVDTLGTSHSLSADTAQFVVLFFNDPDCVDCIIARGRMAANPSANTLIKNGTLKIVSLMPDEPTAEWKEKAARYPAQWIVGAAENAREVYDIRQTPTIYILDKNRQILTKNTSVDELINLFNNMM